MLETKTTELPPPNPEAPMLVTVFTDNLVPDDRDNNASVVWAVSKSHPYVPGVKVLRMFIALERGGIEIYSVSEDGKICMRDLVPMSRLRLAQEAMTSEIFIDELAAAEEGGDDDEDEPEDEPETTQPSANGQAAS
jgi:hypothetical protein